MGRTTARRRSDRLWLAGLGAASVALTAHPVHESDPFWQLTLGRGVLANGARTFAEPVAFADFTNPAVVPEWLFSVATYVLYTAWGWPALSLMLGLTAAAAAWAIVALAREYAPSAPGRVIGLVSLLAVVLISSRMRLRPQAMFMVLLPLFMLLAERYARATGSRATRLGLGLVLVEVLWAQLHGSFVLGPAVLGLVLAPKVLQRPDRETLSRHALVIGGVALAIFTSAHGLETIGYVLAHSGGDAALHMQDMRPPSWASFDPSAHPYAAAYLALWLLALAGALEARRVDLASLGLALLGVAVLSTANRFFAAAGLLLLPLAVEGAAVIVASGPRRATRAIALGAVCGAGALLVWSASIINDRYGPLGRVGVASAEHPRAAAALLAEAPEGARVLSSMSAGGPLGFWLAGHVETYVDARTPLYFDDTDFAVAREIWGHGDALARGLTHFAPWAVVVDRNTVACRSMEALRASDWVPAVVEARFTTFVPKSRSRGLEALRPCGEAYLAEDACRADGAVLAADLAQLAALSGGAFPAYVASEHALGCRGDIDVATAMLPDRKDAWAFRDAHARLAARLALARGDWPGALEQIGPLARAGDVAALNLLGASMPLGSERTFRGVLDDAMAGWRDDAPSELRANLAQLCMGLRDFECARFHGLRAAARGTRRVVPVLRWLALEHPDPRARRDAARWLVTLDGDETRLAER